MDAIEILQAAPNLAFGVICLWFVQQIQRERAAENSRYATSLEKINELYIQLLEKAVIAIANNAALSTANGEAIGRLVADLAVIRTDIGRIMDGTERLVRDSAKRNQSNSGRPSGGTTGD